MQKLQSFQKTKNLMLISNPLKLQKLARENIALKRGRTVLDTRIRGQPACNEDQKK
jgi:hypothetical protein